jgi:four helix bundle protein
MSDYKELRTWQNARQLVKLIYAIAKRLPKYELYDLGSQMRRAVISISLNIAEGHQRGTWKEYVHFLYISRGSAAEVEAQLIHCRDVGYFSEEELIPVMNLVIEVRKQLSSLIASVKRKWKESGSDER